MVSNLRNERIGVQYAAQILGVRITELKDALQHGTDLRGHPPPQPFIKGSGASRKMMLFRMSDVLDVAEKMRRC